MCPPLGAHTYLGKCETSGFCLCQPSLVPTVTGFKPQPDLAACLPLPWVATKQEGMK